MPAKDFIYVMYAFVCLVCVSNALYANGNGSTSRGNDLTCKGYRLPPPQAAKCVLKPNHGILCDSSYRNITNISKYFPGGLFEFNLSHNNISYLGNDSFNGCSLLVILDLSFNIISVIDEDAFAQLHQLGSLLLTFNQLTFTNPTHLLQNNPSLRHLSIDHNALWNNGSQIFRNKRKLKVISMDTTLDMEFDNNFSELKHLNTVFLFGDIQCVTNQTFERFVHLKYLKKLAFTGNGLERIDKTGFSYLRYINTLDLNNNNRLDFPVVRSMALGLRYTKIEDLHIRNISQIYPNQINTNFYKAFENVSTLTLLDMGSNNIEMIDFQDICKYIPNLSSFNFMDNILREVQNYKDLGNCKMLQHLNAELQRNLLQLPFKELNLPPSIQILNINNALKVKRIHQLTLHGAQKLNKINMGHIWIDTIIGPVQFSKPCKTNIDLILNDNLIQHIHYGAFHHTMSRCMHTLALQKNKLGFFISKLDSNFFLHYDNLNVLDLSYNEITSMQVDLFKNLVSLKQLILISNHLTSLLNTVNLQSVKYLDVSYNDIKYLKHGEITSIGLSDKTSNGTFSLNLFQNPLVCTCESLHFLQWLANNPVGVTGWISNKCKNLDNGAFSTALSTKLIPDLYWDCNLEFWLIIGGSTLIVVLIMTVMCVCIYRKRWHIRYWCIKSARARKRYQYLQETESFLYDAFVMYNSDDLEWITHELVPNLEKGESDEDTQNVTVCLHHRDFIGGNYIAENIVEAIDNSRKCILVLSRNFCKSEWTHFEMQMARARAINERHNIIIVIRLEEVPFCEISNTLLHILQTHTYIEYPVEEQGRAAFWAKVKTSINEPC